MDDKWDDEDIEDEGYHQPWCVGDCDGMVEMEGGFVHLPCGCPCHDSWVPERPGEIIVQRPDGSEMPPQSRRYLATAAAARDYVERERERERQRKAAEEQRAGQ